MSTAEQITANRANAQLSTGPKTEAGKAASSQNSWQHGLTFGVFRVLEREDQSRYEALLQQLLGEYKPATPTEAILVERMAQHHWMRNRALYFQSHYIESGDEINMPKLALFMRYETMHERAYHKCLADLLKLRANKQKQEIGFASQTHKQEMRRLDLLCREADVTYRQTRAVTAQFYLECKEQHTETASARENREASMQKAA
ncbi:MAG TPA: hypothetical protein VK604_16340 [Bryobacteraceae bacterium]|nr:hypothetical protein [Bryobacteraceae bacterium]